MTRDEKVEAVMGVLTGLVPCWYCGTYLKKSKARHWVPGAYPLTIWEPVPAQLCTVCNRLKGSCSICQRTYYLKTLRWFDYNASGPRDIRTACGHCRWAFTRPNGTFIPRSDYAMSPDLVPPRQKENVH